MPEANQTEPLTHAPRQRRMGCFSIGFVVLGIIFVAGNFIPPVTFMGCAVTPTRFRGQVIDQNGAPVAGAQVDLSRHTTFLSKGTRSEIKADRDGNFSVLGVFGAGLYVSVSKQGYYQFFESHHGKDLEKSAKSFYGARENRSSPSKVEIFRLWKPIPGEELIHHSERSYRIARDGTPKVINLVLDGAYPEHSIEIRCWTHDENPVNGRGYDWRCEIRAINGSLKHRTDSFAFEAPIDGYLPKDVIDMPRLINGQINIGWKSNMAHDYFLRFDDDVFARAKIEMIAGGDHFVVIESKLNSKPGSRNLSVVPE